MNDCFSFRIITVGGGVEVIDPSVPTPYSSLEPGRMLEYIEMDERLAEMERLRNKAKKEHLGGKKTLGRLLGWIARGWLVRGGEKRPCPHIWF